MKEDYVSREVAGLLRDSGFDVPCRAYYNDDGALKEDIAFPNDWSRSGFSGHITAPNFLEACRWMRKEKRIYIEVFRSRNTFLFGARIIDDKTGILILRIKETFQEPGEAYNRALTYSLGYVLNQDPLVSKES